LLISNLLPVLSCPERIWSGITSLQKTNQVYSQISTGDGVIISGGRLYTFAHLKDDLCPLRKVIDVSTITNKDMRDEWLADKDKGRLYTWLLNSCLRAYLDEVGLIQDEKGRYFFPPVKSPRWTFLSIDFNDLTLLAGKLRNPTDSVSSQISNALLRTTRNALDVYAGNSSHAGPLREALADEFNKIVQGQLIYHEQLFAGVVLRAETRELLSTSPPDQLIRLNRLLLEDVYPREISDARRVILDGREVTARKASPQPGQDFWVHYAAEIRFYRIWNQFFLRIIPCFFFTHDGINPLDGKKMGKLSIRWGGSQRNPAILRDFLFWANFLRRASTQIRISAGAESIEIRPLPATTRLGRGIRHDHIRFTKLMRFTADELNVAATDIQVTESEDDEDKDSPE
jgi:hypothetical protein